MYSSDALNLRATRAPAQGWWTKSARRPITPPRRAGRNHETADPLRPRWRMRSSHVNRVEHNPLLGGQGAPQPYGFSFPTALPDVAHDELRSLRFVWRAKPLGLGNRKSTRLNSSHVA